MDNQRKRIMIFAVVTGLFWFSLYTYSPTFSPYLEELGISHGFIGIIIGSYGFVQMIFRIPLGILSDKLNRRKIFVMLGVLLGTISSLGLAIVENPYLILLFRSLAGAAAATWVTYTILFSSYFETEETSKAIGLINSFTKIGQVAAMLLGGIVAQYLGARFPFLLGAVGGLIGLVLSKGVDENKDLSRETIEFSELLQVLKDYNLLVVSFMAVIVQFVTRSTIFGFTPVIAQNIGASEAQLGMLQILGNIPSILAAVLAGTIFSDYLGEVKTIIFGFIIMTVTTVYIPYISNLNILYLIQLIGGFGSGLIYPLLMSLSIKHIANNHRATAMGFFQAVYGLGMFIGPVMVGFISDGFGLIIAFWFTGIIAFLGAVLSGVLIKNT